MNQLYDTALADISRLNARLDDIPEPVEATLEVAAGLTSIRIMDILRRHEERLVAVEERLSPPEKEAAMPTDEGHAAPEPDFPSKHCWDRDGVQWTAKRYQRVPGRTTDDILWEALFPDSRRPGYERIAQMLGENLEALRGPITWAQRSKDEIALPADKWDRFGIRWSATRAVWHDGRDDIEWMSSKPIGGGATRPAVMTGTDWRSAARSPRPRRWPKTRSPILTLARTPTLSLAARPRNLGCGRSHGCRTSTGASLRIG